MGSERDRRGSPTVMADVLEAGACTVTPLEPKSYRIIVPQTVEQGGNITCPHGLVSRCDRVARGQYPRLQAPRVEYAHVTQPARILAANGRNGCFAAFDPGGGLGVPLRPNPVRPTPWAYDGVPGEGSIPVPLPPPFVRFCTPNYDLLRFETGRLNAYELCRRNE
jgi:hypothetical protein